MQKWYDEGYFTPELLMRRTNIDADWVSVADLIRHAGSSKIFLSHQTGSAPPGLSRPLDSSPPSATLIPIEQSSEPYHPTPLRTLRTTALESYIGSGSNMSESPTSSFGGGTYSNDSPDIASHGAASTHSYSGLDANRVTGANQVSDPSAFSGVRRSTYHDPMLDPSISIRPSFGNIGPGRASTLDSYGLDDYSVPPSSWSSSSNMLGPQFDGMPAVKAATDTSSFSSNVGSSVSPGPPLLPQGIYPGARGGQEALFIEANAIPIPDYAAGDFGHQHLPRPPEDNAVPVKLGFNEFANGPFANSSPNQQYAVPTPVLYHAPPQPPMQQLPSHYIPPLGATSPLPQAAVSPVNTRSPWITHDSTAVRRPDPFGPSHPTSANTIPNGQPVPPRISWASPNQAVLPNSVSTDQSPWFVASHGVLDDGWKDNAEPSSLTFKNVAQHNQLQQELAIKVESEVNVNSNAVPERAHQLAASESVPPPIVAPASSTTPASGPVKSRRKSTAHVHVPTSKQIPAPTQIAKSPSSPSLPSAPMKAAWLNDDETKKTKPSQATLSLRDIQDAEAKKNEARKAVERERERQSRGIAVPAAVEELQPFTATWGLPTSQAGARNNTSHKEAPPATSTPSTSAVWTNTSKAISAKKSMKEIQEEEEQRKKNAVKETVAAAAAKRVYSESITKVGTFLDWGYAVSLTICSRRPLQQLAEPG